MKEQEESCQSEKIEFLHLAAVRAVSVAAAGLTPDAGHMRSRHTHMQQNRRAEMREKLSASDPDNDHQLSTRARVL